MFQKDNKKLEIQSTTPKATVESRVEGGWQNYIKSAEAGKKCISKYKNW